VFSRGLCVKDDVDSARLGVCHLGCRILDARSSHEGVWKGMQFLPKEAE
jgi:hypothetical protein